MSRPRVIIGLAARNSAQAWGRVLILVLLLSAALVARSATHLVQDGLCARAVSGISGADQGTLPRDFNTVVLSTETSFGPEMVHAYVWRGLRFMPWERPQYLTGHAARYLGPGGEIWVVRPWSELAVTYVRMRGPQPLGRDEWSSSIDGRYPERADEVAVPAAYATTHHLALGDRVSLVNRDPTGEPAVFTVSGIYTPKGKGPFYEYFLSVIEPGTVPLVNWLCLNLSSGSAAVVRAFGGDPATGYTGTLVHEYLKPADRMRDLARAVYGAQSRAADTGFALVGVAVLVVLLVAMVERRREAAIYKMVGMSNVAILSVLTLELAVALVISVLVAAPIYWLVATRFILDVYGASFALLWSPFAASTAWILVVAAAGAAYPFALASVGAPNQLLTGQKIYLFRRRQVLRGWADIDTGNGS